MSKIGKKTIAIPDKVTVSVEKGGTFDNIVVKVTGPQGTLIQDIRKDINVEVSDNTITVSRNNDMPTVKAFHGLYRSLIANNVIGVVQPYEKRLEIQGVGYRGSQKGASIEMSLGFSHKVTYTPQDGVVVKMVDDTNISITGIDKQLVGETAAEIRELRKPEPYKGKGIRYLGEQVRRKAGKTAASK